MTAAPGAAARSLALAALLCASADARAGVLTRDALARAFPPPYSVGERDASLPVWPIFRRNGPPAFTLDLAGYVFESVDLAPIPGFSGEPIDLLVAIDPGGTFIDVKVISQHEPVFVGGIGEEPLVRFVSQYKGLNLKQNVKVGRDAAGAARGGSTNAYVDGVAKATASVRIVNQSVLSAALRVARAKLGFSGRRDPGLVASVRADLFEPRTWDELQRAGLVQRLVVRNRDVERAFAGTAAAGLDPEALRRPDDPFLDVYVAVATVPTVGRNLLDPAGFGSMIGRIEPGDHVLLVMSGGRYSLVDADFVRGSVPDRLSLAQGGFAIELRDLDLDSALRPIGQPAFEAWRAFRVIGQSGLDLGAPAQLTFRATRTHGVVYPERVSRDFALELAVPARFLVPAAGDERGWRGVWRAQRVNVAVLALSLAFLAWVLARPSRLVTRAERLRWFRPAFLAFTLAFIGWYAQGQLSIVNVIALLQAAVAGRSWTFFLYDPMSVVLWAFALAALAVWGRGTFCGWLCPFGALQELSSRAARLVRVPRIRLPAAADRRLKRLKVLVLLIVLVPSLASRRWGDTAVEVEPFKTAITLAFARSWPYVAYAAALVAAGAVLEKAFCRYLCPLGASLALLGRLRRFTWLARRAECGHPCQTCRSHCDYQAIDREGRVDYAECFQCMECVAIYHGEGLCTPRILESKGKRMKIAPPGPDPELVSLTRRSR